jgi:tetratricopeptide (TPR) repeat protein
VRVAVYAICRDEAAFAERFAKTAREADYMVVADTGSTDGCQLALAAQGVIVHQIGVTPWRFDDARNAALALVPADVDVCLSLDLDEVVAPGWRAALEAGWTPKATRAFYNFVASHNADGSDGISFQNNRLHVRNGYRWRHACHEGLYPDRIEEQFISLPGIRVDHWPDDTKSRSNYLGLLEVAVHEEPNDARMAHYYARELYFYGRHAEAVEAFSRYLAMNGDQLAERAASLNFGARCLDALGRGEEAMQWRWRAVGECPRMREPWCDLSEALYKLQDWPASYAAARKALSITEHFPGYMTEARAWGFTPDDLAAIAAWNLGLKAEALGHARRALSFAPDDPRLIANVDSIRTEVEPSARGETS